MTVQAQKIGFIGLGNMGLPMAQNLVKSGYQLVGFDLASDARRALANAGGAVADSVGLCVAGAEVVVSMLPAGAHVASVYGAAGEGVLASAMPGTLLIDCSTIDVETARAVADDAASAGFDMVDAPVSGGVGGASAATLTFMVGGSDTAFARAKPILEYMGQNVFHAGASGNGQVAKICNNMLLGISMIGTSEAFKLAERLGLDAQTLFDISSTASGQCWSMTSYCPMPGPVPTSPANRDYQAGFTAAMMRKDLQLAVAAAEGSAAQIPLGAHASTLYEKFCAEADGGLDFSAIIKSL